MRRILILIVLGALLVSALATLGGGTVKASNEPVPALSAAWDAFHTRCIAGPSPGQGSRPSSCVCWERNLQAQAILPAYALEQLDVAQVGGGANYVTSENLSGDPVGWAGHGCGLAGT